jgi:hypothetical protein
MMASAAAPLDCAGGADNVEAGGSGTVEAGFCAAAGGDAQTHAEKISSEAERVETLIPCITPSPPRRFCLSLSEKP